MAWDGDWLVCCNKRNLKLDKLMKEHEGESRDNQKEGTVIDGVTILK
jgi:hypothetical protein